MRWIGPLSAALCVACFCTSLNVAHADDTDQADEMIPPYHTHIDRRNGNDHVYPDRGAVVRNLPRGASVVNYAGISYRFAGGVWYEQRGPAYIVVAPPIGLVVQTLPAFATNVERGGQSWLYANDVYYRPRPDLGGYEVVNDPADSAPAQSHVTGAAPPAGIAPPAGVAPPIGAAARVFPAGPESDPVPSLNPTAKKAVPATASRATSVGQVHATAPSAAPLTAQAPLPATPHPQIPATARAAVPPTARAAVPATARAAIPSTPGAAIPSTPGAAGPATPGAAGPALASTALPVGAPAVTPATGASSAAQSSPTRVLAYPLDGQSADAQARDRYACYQFAVKQSGFDPLRSGRALSPADAAQRRSDYTRAQAACLLGRGYSVR